MFKRLFLILTLGTASVGYAETSNRIVAIDAMIGLPQLMGIEISYVGLPFLEFGIGFGSAPVNNTLNAKAGLAPIPVDLQLSSTYKIYPNSTFSLTSFTPWVRYFPFSKNLYVQLAYSMARAAADVSGDLKDDVSGFTSPGVVNGSLKYVQSIFTLSAGYRPYLTPNFFLNFQGGISWLNSSSYTLDVGGSLANVISLVPAGQQAFDQAVASIRSKVDSAISQYRDKVTFIPSVMFSAGIAF